MAVIIDWHEKTILKCSNSILYGLYSSMLEIIDKEDLSFNEAITKLIDRLDVASDGIGFDLANYIYTKEELIAFTNLVRKGIDQRYKEIPGLPETTTERLEFFYKNLLEIQKSFPKHNVD